VVLGTSVVVSAAIVVLDRVFVACAGRLVALDAAARPS